MKFYQSSALIEADVDKIWNILIDGPGYANWNSGVEKIEGAILPLQKISVYSTVSPGRAFPVTVSQFEPGKKMVWSGGMPLGLFSGERKFTLTPESDTLVKFLMREEFTGLMLPLIWPSMPDLTESFEQFARGLKARAESI